nr:hypothetical protein [Tanacetum cinerariifolium]
SEMMMEMVSRKRIYTSYERKMGTKHVPLLFRLTCLGIGSADGVVESYETKEWDETVLVPDGSEAINSSLIKGHQVMRRALGSSKLRHPG